MFPSCTESIPQGWHYDEDTGALMRDVIHRMGRRCNNWDYKGRGVYLITVEAGERGRGKWGRVEAANLEDSAASGRARTALQPPRGASQPPPGSCEAVGAGPLAARFIPNAIGSVIEREWLKLPENWPGVRILACQVMEDHFHGVIATPSFMEKPLGSIIGSFKARVSSEVGSSIWAKGYVDTILGDEESVEKGIAYTLDNPRRLAEKRANPELFQVVRDLMIGLGRKRPSAHRSASAAQSPAPAAQSPAPAALELRSGERRAACGTVPEFGHFSAIGNQELLNAPLIYQVQCSRSFFEYRRGPDGRLLKNAPPRVMTDEFIEKRDGFLEAAAKGAVLLSPCISHGEKEIARNAFEKGLKVITLSNKGFSPLYKPGGKLFDATAAGNLLMLAPAAWPYQPGEKKITRPEACILNRIAQWLCGSGAVEIRYRGVESERVDEMAREALCSSP